MILLDTHAWLWWSVGSRTLTKGARRAIEDATVLGLSPFSLYEVAYAHYRGRLAFELPLNDWLAESLSADIAILPVTPSIAAAAGTLDWPHGDPADRILVATAKHHGIPLVTGDRQIQKSGLVEVVW